MKKFIIQNAIVNINNEKINILILENKEKLEKYILYLLNINNENIIKLSNKFEKFEFKDNISITPKKKFIDSKIEIFYDSSTKKHSLLLNKKQIYFTLNPHITLYNENIIIDDNYKLIKSDSRLYNLSEIIISPINDAILDKSNDSTSKQSFLGLCEDNLISKILNDNRNKIDENIELNGSESEKAVETINLEITTNSGIIRSYVTTDSSGSEYEQALLGPAETACHVGVFKQLPQPSISSKEIMDNLSISKEDTKESKEEYIKDVAKVVEKVIVKVLEEENKSLINKKEIQRLPGGLVSNAELLESVACKKIQRISDETPIDLPNFVEDFERLQEKEEDSYIKIINLNSKIIPSNHETLSDDCKEIKIIEKKFEDDKEIKNIEILKMDNPENKFKNILDIDKIMTDFNNLFNNLSKEEKELELPKHIFLAKLEETKEQMIKDNIISKKINFSEKNSTLSNIERFPKGLVSDVMQMDLPKVVDSYEKVEEFKKDNHLLYNKFINYQNINYKIPTIRILPTQNLNFSNLYSTQIQKNNILLNQNLSIELGKDNLSYLIKILNQKYLINKTDNSIVLTNLFNKNSQIIKNKDNFKIGMLDYILYNECTLLMQVTNNRYFDNSYGRTISIYTPKF
jgi:hypothetical protein